MDKVQGSFGRQVRDSIKGYGQLTSSQGSLQNTSKILKMNDNVRKTLNDISFLPPDSKYS